MSANNTQGRYGVNTQNGGDVTSPKVKHQPGAKIEGRQKPSKPPKSSRKASSAVTGSKSPGAP